MEPTVVTATLAIGSEETIGYILNKDEKGRSISKPDHEQAEPSWWLLEQGSRWRLGRRVGSVGGEAGGAKEGMSATRVREKKKGKLRLYHVTL
jgi:hypothetical protein